MLEAACALFLERGYEVNMAAVARTARVSKQTVYSHFGTKEALFRQAVEQLMRPVLQLLGEGDQDAIASALQRFATQHLARTLDPQTVALSRRLVAEADRFPQAAAALFAASADQVRGWLARRLAGAAARGELDLAHTAGDAGMAAEILLGMLAGLDADRRRLGLPVREGLARQRWIDTVIAMFLSLFGTPSTRGAPPTPSGLPG